MDYSDKPTFISLFSGCGGFDAGFEASGFKCLGAFDNEPAVLEVYQKNLSGPTYLHDLSKHSLPVDIKSIDVLLAGSPCQGFSTAGQRELEDPRNSLLLVTGTIAQLASPKVIVCENVMGSIAGKHKIYWEELEKVLRRLGYNLNIAKFQASDFGLAQMRKRVFLFAWKGGTDIEFAFETQAKKTLRDALKGVSGLPSQELFVDVKDSKTLNLVKRINQGQKLCNVRGGNNSVHTWEVPEVFGEVSEVEKQVLYSIKKLRRAIRLRKNGDADPVCLKDIERHLAFPVEEIVEILISKGYIRKVGLRYDLKHSYNGLYRRLAWDKHSMTVDTRFGNPRFFLHPDEHRGFSVREAARIQGFSDDFVFSGSMTEQFKMIGNAVPPPMAKAIADNIKSQWFRNEPN